MQATIELTDEEYADLEAAAKIDGITVEAEISKILGETFFLADGVKTPRAENVA